MDGVKFSRISTDKPTEKIIIVGTGPSLLNFDFDKLYGLGFIIAVNEAGNDLSNANMWFTLDPWGLHGPQLPKNNFKGELWAAVPEDYALITSRYREHRVTAPKHVKYLHRIVFNTTNANNKEEYLQWGLNEDTSCVNTLNSGYGALNIAYHLRPKKILLLGIDATAGYYYDPAKKTRPLNILPWIFESTNKQLTDKKIQIVNGSVASKITCFPRLNIDDALNWIANDS